MAVGHVFTKGDTELCTAFRKVIKFLEEVTQRAVHVAYIQNCSGRDRQRGVPSDLKQ